jgi:CheY-like chemotaxis protein
MRPVRYPRILAVDDRRENLVALEAILEGLPVDVHTVDSGERALKKLMTESYAAILLDAQMPGMDGFETAAHIKQRERTRNIPIIFLTAADYDPRLAFRGYQVGAVDYLTKPLDPWILRSKVSVFADLWTAQAELSIQAGDYAALRDAVDSAVDMLEEPSPRSEEVVKVLRAARGHRLPAAPRIGP